MDSLISFEEWLELRENKAVLPAPANAPPKPGRPRRPGPYPGSAEDLERKAAQAAGASRTAAQRERERTSARTGYRPR
jgi:hypothetical protein